MPFPFTRVLEGRLPGAPDAVMKSLAATLKRLNATELKTSGNEVTFEIPVTAGRPQSNVDAGRCTVVASGSDSVVSIELSFRRTGLILAGLIVVWVGGVGGFVLGITDPVELVTMLAIGFLWIHGFAYVVGSWWFRRELEL